MPEQAASTGSPQQTNISADKANRRNVWVLTGYAASFLGLLAVLAYYFSNYVSH
ncbi:MAG: hypothetical protein ACE14M_00670 [Terriglobales bacterium]